MDNFVFYFNLQKQKTFCIIWAVWSNSSTIFKLVSFIKLNNNYRPTILNYNSSSKTSHLLSLFTFSDHEQDSRSELTQRASIFLFLMYPRHASLTGKTRVAGRHVSRTSIRNPTVRTIPNFLSFRAAGYSFRDGLSRFCVVTAIESQYVRMRRGNRAAETTTRGKAVDEPPEAKRRGKAAREDKPTVFQSGSP